MSCCGSSSTSTGASFGNVRVAASSVTNFGTSTRQNIGVGGGFTFVNIIRIKLKRTAGTAASFTPRLYDAVAALSGSIDQQFVGSVTAVADLFDVACVGCVFRTDATGQFYLEPGPNAGADNAFDYEIYYEVL
jgi:hypothetical protein